MFKSIYHRQSIIFLMLTTQASVMCMRRSLASKVKTPSTIERAISGRVAWSYSTITSEEKKSNDIITRKHALTQQIRRWKNEVTDAKASTSILSLTTLAMSGAIVYSEGLPPCAISLTCIGGMAAVSSIPPAFFLFARYKLKRKIAELELLNKKISDDEKQFRY